MKMFILCLALLSSPVLAMNNPLVLYTAVDNMTTEPTEYKDMRCSKQPDEKEYRCSEIKKETPAKKDLSLKNFMMWVGAFLALVAISCVLLG